MRTLYPGVLGIACCAFVLNSSAQSLGQGPSTEQQSTASTVEVSRQAAKEDALASAELPDSPSTTLSQQQASAQSQTVPPPPSDARAQGQEQQRPVGTAAAEAPKVSGITAAQPAGVAIAPAKQRRMRTIVLKVGAIVGAGAALGAVIALTEATPSKPPGAH
ncbi:MAG: hypothetical protein WA485_00830 [Candidatus Sulfotelmatobacter sp.]